MLRCARCTYPLSVIEHQGVHVDHCKRCGGVFLERGETSAALAPEAEPEVWVRSRIAVPLGPVKLRCPKDQALFAGYRVSLGSATVEVDVCSTCRGLWLDNYEGPKLRFIAEEAGRMGTGAVSQVERVGQVAREAYGAQYQHDEVSPPGVASYFFQLFTGLPIEVNNPVKIKPVTVYSMIAVLCLVFLIQAAAGDEFNEQLWLVPVEVLRGEQLWTLLTSTFLHGGIAHLLGNLYFLWIFGDNVEDKLAPSRFSILYFSAGLAASLLHTAFNASATIPCVGASGAIAGLMGAYLSMFPKTKVWVVFFFIRFRLSVYWYLGFWIALQVVMGAIGAPGVAWYAHIGGFFAGLSLAPFLKKRD